jgi:hypothetical protein
MELESEDKNSDKFSEEASKPYSDNVTSRKREIVETLDLDVVSAKKLKKTPILISV